MIQIGFAEPVCSLGNLQIKYQYYFYVDLENQKYVNKIYFDSYDWNQLKYFNCLKITYKNPGLKLNFYSKIHTLHSEPIYVQIINSRFDVETVFYLTKKVEKVEILNFTNGDHLLYLENTRQFDKLRFEIND